MKQGVAMKSGPVVYLLVIVTSLLLIPSASATWSGFRSMGTTVTLGEPSCVQLAAQDVVCVAQSQQSTLMTNRFTNNAWSGWTNLAGAVSSDPRCVNDGNGHAVCGVRSGTTRTLVATVFDGTNWSAFIDSNGQIFSGPSCALLRSTKVLCAARSLTSKPVHYGLFPGRVKLEHRSAASKRLAARTTAFKSCAVQVSVRVPNQTC
jgi:hypothetical protein